MKSFILSIILASSVSVFAQKADTLIVTAKIPDVIEKNMIDRERRMAELKKEIESLQKQNADDYKAILQFNDIDEKRIIGQPKYEPGKLIFRTKR